MIADSVAENDAKWQAKFNDGLAQARGAKKAPKGPPTSEAVAVHEEWERKQAEKAINQTLHANMESLGTINPSNVTKYFKANYGERLNVDDDGVVQFTESDGKVTPLKDYLHAWAKSDEGQTFVPAKRGPVALGGGYSTAPVSAASPYRSMTYEQIMDRRRIDPNGVGAYMTAYESEFHNKRVEYTRGYVNR